CAFHLNLGYTYNDNKIDERKDIWKVSAATEVEVMKGLKVVADIGIEKNTDKSSNTNPAFVIGGLIYSIAKNLDIDFGIKAGLNKAEADMTVLAGMTFKF
ncbi:MAG: transporter, partial [Thermodesulfovibrionales bacterium]|nr:transporter [Thermodesulfovibrionales bacterium]